MSLSSISLNYRLDEPELLLEEDLREPELEERLLLPDERPDDEEPDPLDLLLGLYDGLEDCLLELFRFVTLLPELEVDFLRYVGTERVPLDFLSLELGFEIVERSEEVRLVEEEERVLVYTSSRYMRLLLSRFLLIIRLSVVRSPLLAIWVDVPLPRLLTRLIFAEASVLPLLLSPVA